MWQARDCDISIKWLCVRLYGNFKEHSEKAVTALLCRSFNSAGRRDKAGKKGITEEAWCTAIVNTKLVLMFCLIGDISNLLILNTH